MDAVREREARFPDKRIAAMANNDGYTPGIRAVPAAPPPPSTPPPVSAPSLHESVFSSARRGSKGRRHPTAGQLEL